jgi:ABC-type dipeptide/oligopeptide/nickel transport system ATPase component
LSENLLEVQDLKTYFKTKAGYVHAVDGVNFAIKPGEKVAIVGESGCGKKRYRPLDYETGRATARGVRGRLYFLRWARPA